MNKKPHPAFKVWLETDNGYVFGPGIYSLLRKIEETGTLKDAANSLGMSYRYAWGLVKHIENRLGASLLESHKGGSQGGGGTNLTELGRQFILEYTELKVQINQISKTSYEGTIIETNENEKTILIKLTNHTLKLNKGTMIKFTPLR